MDSVRFGRALGFGARSAAKALAGAVDAATAPNPSAKGISAARPPHPAQPATINTPPSSTANGPARTGPIASAAKAAAHATIRARNTRTNLSRGGKRFGEALWGPFVKLSGVLWLEITGAFFGIFGIFAGQAAWTHRFDLHASANPAARNHVIVLFAMTIVFAWFCISSFVRAHRRQRSK